MNQNVSCPLLLDRVARVEEGTIFLVHQVDKIDVHLIRHLASRFQLKRIGRPDLIGWNWMDGQI